jgi:hypothetical protein
MDGYGSAGRGTPPGNGDMYWSRLRKTSVYWNFVDVREGTFDSIIVISYVSWSSWSYSLPVCMRIGGEKKR